MFGANFLKPDSHYDSIIVSEGYMDVATMHQFGIENSVGTMGTAIASGQIESLFEFTNHLIFCFDGDEAGTKAANRAVKNARQTLSGNRKVSVVFLPDGHDPDSILRKDTNGTPLTPQLIQDGV
ncbi:toprim domain-containing protein, partial [Vibrio anguillarum]|uniref:toprim domain-containing protein n=1 Tax=Vibrio anguillarum TaxID=55601 RepID=UPI001ECDEBE9|nr:toprim domain-containing protein [Vibrio anguillarum]